MENRLLLIAFFSAVVACIYAVSMLSTPGKGFTKVLERTAAGALLCFACYLLLLPFGIRLPQSPLAAVLAGYLGFPGVALSAFVSLWP